MPKTNSERMQFYITFAPQIQNLATDSLCTQKMQSISSKLHLSLVSTKVFIVVKWKSSQNSLKHDLQKMRISVFLQQFLSKSKKVGENS
jgi:hypothetical protein